MFCTLSYSFFPDVVLLPVCLFSSYTLTSYFSHEEKKNNSKSNSKDEDNYFFELFGLKLYLDDILLLCLLFFLYQEGVKDDELFLSLVLLLLS